MKLLVVSDSHGDLDALRLAVRRERPQAVIHLGDHCSDADELASEFAGLPVMSVRGNCDFDTPTRADTLVREMEGVRIFAAHGHKYGVKTGCLNFRYAALEQGAHLALFGHTHSPFLCEEDGLCLMNPGACSGAHPGYGVVTLQNGSVSCCLNELFPEDKA